MSQILATHWKHRSQFVKKIPLKGWNRMENETCLKAPISKAFWSSVLTNKAHEHILMSNMDLRNANPKLMSKFKLPTNTLWWCLFSNKCQSKNMTVFIPKNQPRFDRILAEQRLTFWFPRPACWAWRRRVVPMGCPHPHLSWRKTPSVVTKKTQVTLAQPMILTPLLVKPNQHIKYTNGLVDCATCVNFIVSMSQCWNFLGVPGELSTRSKMPSQREMPKS